MHGVRRVQRASAEALAEVTLLLAGQVLPLHVRLILLRALLRRSTKILSSTIYMLRAVLKL